MRKLLSRKGFTGLALPLALAGLAIAGVTDHLTRKAHADDDGGGAKRYQVNSHTYAAAEGCEDADVHPDGRDTASVPDESRAVDVAPSVDAEPR